MSKREILYCDRRGCGRLVEKIDSENKFTGFSSLKIRCWSKKGFHLCDEHVLEFKENYTVIEDFIAKNEREFLDQIDVVVKKNT